MKEAKYRLWDKKNSIMYTNDFVSNFDFESKCAWVKARSKGGRWLYFKDAEIMQYTGLSDKDGAEIFEGDIVHIMTFSYHEPINKIIATVCYSEHRASFLFKESRPKLCYSSLDEIIDEAHTFQTEVVGNIYENPELLSKHDTSKTPINTLL